MNRYAVKMIDWRGHHWDFTDQWEAGIKSGGIDGLVGSMVDVTAEPLGQSGHVVLAQRAAPTTGQVLFHCRGGVEKSASEVAADFRQAFSGSVLRRNALFVHSPYGRVHAQVRLDGMIPSPVEDPSWSELVLNVQVPLVLDEGVWWMPTVSGTGKVTVVNTGDVPVWVRLRWSGSGGTVTMPSGATFTLPAVSSERVLTLSRRDSLIVRDSRGVVDPVAWKKVRAVFPEPVPVGESRVFIVPSNVKVEYEVGVLDPWL